MGIEKYGEKSVEALKKAGTSILTFKLVPHFGDHSFDEKLLCADIYILRKDEYPDVPESLPKENFQGTVSSDEGFFCEVQVESIFGFFKRISERKRQEPIDVWVIVEPDKDQEHHYERTIYDRKFSSGREFPLKVKLKPTHNKI